MRKGVLVLLVLLVAVPGFVSADEPVRKDIVDHPRILLDEVKGDVAAVQPFEIEPFTPCYAGEIACAQTRMGRVSVDSCEANSVYGVGYLLRGTQGRTITIAAQSFDFAASVYLADGRQGRDDIYAQAHVFTRGETARISSFRLPYTGDYLILITPGTRVTFGDYSLAITCTSEPPPPSGCTACVPNANTACMLGGRFKTTMTWRDIYAGLEGAGRLISIAGVGDDQTFWSMYPQAPNNIELVVRMVDGRGANGKFWTSAAAFAVAEYTVTIQDTRTCATWQRTVPAGSAEIVRDPNALPGN